MQVDATDLEQGKMGDKVKIEEGPATAVEVNGSEVKVIYKFCDIKASLVDAWKNQFEKYIPDRVKVMINMIHLHGLLFECKKNVRFWWHAH